MVNTTDFQEVEVLLPGEWRREDNDDVYVFTVEKMKLEDERLFRQLMIRHASAPVESSQWALTIKDDYCGIIVGEVEFMIREIGRRKDDTIGMVWEEADGPAILRFIKM